MDHIRPLTCLVTAVLGALSACSVTTPAVPESTTSLAARPPASDLVLRDDGLGPFRFGDSSVTVVDAVTATIGGWDADSNDGDAVAIPSCAEGRVRIVSWGSLVLVFVEQSGAEVFTGWSYGFDPLTGNSDDHRGLGLTTSEGIMLGSDSQDLIEAYGPAVSITDDTDLDTATFVVSSSGPTRLAGRLDRTGPMGSVDYLETTPGC